MTLKKQYLAKFSNDTFLKSVSNSASIGVLHDVFWKCWKKFDFQTSRWTFLDSFYQIESTELVTSRLPTEMGNSPNPIFNLPLNRISWILKILKDRLSNLNDIWNVYNNSCWFFLSLEQWWKVFIGGVQRTNYCKCFFIWCIEI